MDTETQQSNPEVSENQLGQSHGETAQQVSASHGGTHHHDGEQHHHHHHHSSSHHNLKEGELYLGSDGHYHHYRKNRNRDDETERYKHNAIRNSRIRRAVANALFTIMMVMAVLVIIAVAIVAFFPVF